MSFVLERLLKSSAGFTIITKEEWKRADLFHKWTCQLTGAAVSNAMCFTVRDRRCRLKKQKCNSQK